MATKQVEQVNGGTLPASRQAAVEQGLHMFQEVAADRDQLAVEVTRMRSDIAGLKVVIEALEAQLADAQSRVATATIVRDAAVSDRAEYKTILISIQSQLRAFGIKHEPLVVERRNDKDEQPATGGA